LAAPGGALGALCFVPVWRLLEVLQGGGIIGINGPPSTGVLQKPPLGLTKDISTYERRRL
ncbi:MAG: hypothetical protein ACI9C2_002666, partial [Gammaproteobacteria bacterium]